MSKRSAAIFVAIAAFWLITGLMTVHRTGNGSNDFDTFYQAGQSLLQGDSLYAGQARTSGEGTLGPFLYLPFSACVFAPFALLPVSMAALLWHTLNFFLFGGCLWLLTALIPSGKSLFGLENKAGPFEIQTLVLAFMALAFFMDNISMAQANILVFFVTLAALLLERRDRPFTAGFVMSVAILLKVVPVLFCFYYLLRGKWRTLSGALSGVLLLSLTVPALFLGWDRNIEAHSQWAENMIKPTVKPFSNNRESKPINLLEPVPWGAMPRPEILIIRKQEEARKARIDSLLNPKNQSLEAALSRWLIRDRNLYASSDWYPIWPAKRYQALPTIGNGIPEQDLLRYLAFIPLFFVLCLSLFLRAGDLCADKERAANLQLALVFLTITLIAPFLRSHQFIMWLFPLFALTDLQSRVNGVLSRRLLAAGIYSAAFLYFAQAVPYGKAAGMGTWANMVLWLVSAGSVISLERRKGAVAPIT